MTKIQMESEYLTWTLKAKDFLKEAKMVLTQVRNFLIPSPKLSSRVWLDKSC